MGRKYFGTDGIRGLANSQPMTAEIAMRVGMASGIAFRRGQHRHRVVIGKDTRLSGYMIENALVAGFTAAGMDVFQLGPVPTPAVAMLTRSLRADIGVMISASHNGMPAFSSASRHRCKIRMLRQYKPDTGWSLKALRMFESRSIAASAIRLAVAVGNG